VRNRVAGSRTRSLVNTRLVRTGLVKVAMVGGLLMVVTAQAATAAQENTLEGSMPMNIAGPLGITVAAIGLVGLVLGLWRFLRKAAKARTAAPAVTSAAASVEAQQPAKPRTPAQVR
jgi:hypothetical protein